MIGPIEKQEEKNPAEYLIERELCLSTTIGRILSTTYEINECRQLSKNGQKIKVPQYFCDKCVKKRCTSRQTMSL